MVGGADLGAAAGPAEGEPPSKQPEVEVKEVEFEGWKFVQRKLVAEPAPMPCDDDEPLSLVSLPGDMTSRVLGELAGKDLGAVQLVCRALRDAARSDEGLWEGVCRREVQQTEPSPVGGSWRDAYFRSVRTASNRREGRYLERPCDVGSAMVTRLAVQGGLGALVLFDGGVGVWDLEGSRLVTTIPSMRYPPLCVDTDGMHVATGTSEGRPHEAVVHVHEARGGHTVRTFRLGPGRVKAVRVSGSQVAAVTSRGRLVLLNLDGRPETVLCEEMDQEPRALDMADGRLVCGTSAGTGRTGAGAGSVRLWALPGGEKVGAYRVESPVLSVRLGCGRVVAGGEGGTAYLLPCAGGLRGVTELQGGEFHSEITSLLVQEDQIVLSSTDMGGVVSVWERGGGAGRGKWEVVSVWARNEDSCVCAAVDAKWMVGSVDNGAPFVWDWSKI